MKLNTRKTNLKLVTDREDKWMKNAAARKKKIYRPERPGRTDTEIKRIEEVFNSYILPTDSSRISIPYTLGLRNKEQYDKILEEKQQEVSNKKSKQKPTVTRRKSFGSSLVKKIQKPLTKQPTISLKPPTKSKSKSKVDQISADEKAKIEREFAMARQKKLKQIEEELNMYVKETEDRNKGLIFSQGLLEFPDISKGKQKEKSTLKRKVGPQKKAKLPLIRKSLAPARQKEVTEDPKQLLKKQLLEEEERNRQLKLKQIQEELQIYTKDSEGTLPTQGIRPLKPLQPRDPMQPKEPIHDREPIQRWRETKPEQARLNLKIEVGGVNRKRTSMIEKSYQERDKENEKRNREREENIKRRKEQRRMKQELNSYILPTEAGDRGMFSPQPLGTRLSPHLLSPFSPHPLSPNQGIVPPFSNPVTPHSLLGGRPALPSIKVTGGGEDNMKLALPRNNRFRRLPVVLSTKENNQLYVPQPDMPGFKMSFLDEADAGLDLPAVGLDQDMINLYLEAMDDEKEKIHNIRLIVVGNEGVGKTTLCRRLMGQSIQGVKSTNGIDIKQRIVVNLNTGERSFVENENETQTAINRITDIVIAHKKKRDSKGAVKKPPPPKKKPQPKLKQIEPLHNPNIKFVPKMVPPSAPRTPATPMRKVEDSSVTKEKIYTLKRYHEKDVKAVIDRMNDGNPMQEKAYLSMWDFAGEELFYATHHVFLSNDAVYLVVFDLKQCMEDRKELERIHFWLRSIVTYSVEAKSKRTTATPPIILVGTHLDRVHMRSPVEIDSVMRQMFTLPDIDSLERHLSGIFAVDNSKVDPKLESIWGAILSSAPLQAQWGKELPAKWLSLERELMKQKERGKKILTVRQVSAIARKCEAPINGVEQVDSFLQYLHLSGTIMYYSAENKSNQKSFDSSLKVALDPKWIVDAFRRFMTAPKFARPRRREMRPMWSRFHESGHLTSKLIKDAWTRRDSDRFMTYKRTLLVFMERLGLICHPPYFKASGRASRVPYYVVPHMLQTVDPERLMRSIRCPFLIQSKTLCLVFKNKFVPFPVLDKITASFISTFESYRDPKRCLGCFKLNTVWKIILYCTESAVRMCLFRFAKSGSVESGIGVQLRQFLESTVQRILDTYKHKQIQFDVCLHCDIDGDEPQRYVTVRELEQRRHATCCPNKDGHVLTAEDLEPWYGSKSSYTPDMITRLEMETSLSVLQLDSVPTSRQTAHLCREIGPDYDLLFCELGLDYPVIYRTQELFRYHSINTVIMQLLEKWKKKFWHRATVRALANALILHDMDLSFLDEVFLEDEYPPITTKRFQSPMLTTRFR